MQGLRRALLIGVDQFQSEEIDPLPAVTQDLSLLSSVFLAADTGSFDVVKTHGLKAGQQNLESLSSELEDFFLRGPSAGLDFLYIGTHAWVDDQGELRIVPSDYDPKRPLTTTLPVSYLASCLQYATERAVVLALDCCYADQGAWQLFTGQPTPFSLRQNPRPNYCFIASTRSADPAIGGAFATLFAEAIRELEPIESEERVEIQRLFDYTAQRLQKNFYQKPRIWRSTEFMLPLGRRVAGIVASKKVVEDLYDQFPDRKIRTFSETEPEVLHYIEERKNRYGFLDTTGLHVVVGIPAPEQIGDLICEMEEAVSKGSVRNGIIITTDASGFSRMGSSRVVVMSFTDFRRRLLPVIGYLENAITNYENEEDGIFEKGCYVDLNAHHQCVDGSQPLSEVVRDWTSSVDGTSILLILGEFGAGKTTTVSRFFWDQAKRFLDSPAGERLPIFVRLRDFGAAFDMETLIERSIGRGVVDSGVSFSYLRNLNQMGRVLWILDGFDEMAVRVTDQVLYGNFEQILKLSAHKSRILLTSRTAFFKRREEIDSIMSGTELERQLRTSQEKDHDIFFLEPFSADQIRDFVRLRLKDKAGEFLEKLSRLPEMENLATRPILLEMIVAELPDLLKTNKRIVPANLYQAYTARLLKRDQWRFAIEKVADREAFCRGLAWHFFITGSYEISYRELPNFIKKYFPEAARKAEEFEALGRAIQTTSFLARDEANNFRFAHKSFLEYFAAAYAFSKISESVRGKRETKGIDSVLGRDILPAEIASFLGNLFMESQELREYLAEQLVSGQLSLAYFLNHYLKPRMIPTLNRSRIYSYVQKSRLHIPIHLVLPLFLIGVASTGSMVWTVDKSNLKLIVEPSSLLAGAFAALVGLALTILVYIVFYAYRTLRGVEGDPIQRFNLLSVFHFSGQKFDPNRITRAKLQLSQERQVIAGQVEAAVKGEVVESGKNETTMEDCKGSAFEPSFPGEIDRKATVLAIVLVCAWMVFRFETVRSYSLTYLILLASTLAFWCSFLLDSGVVDNDQGRRKRIKQLLGGIPFTFIAINCLTLGGSILSKSEGLIWQPNWSSSFAEFSRKQKEVIDETEAYILEWRESLKVAQGELNLRRASGLKATDVPGRVMAATGSELIEIADRSGLAEVADLKKRLRRWKLLQRMDSRRLDPETQAAELFLHSLYKKELASAKRSENDDTLSVCGRVANGILKDDSSQRHFFRLLEPGKYRIETLTLGDTVLYLANLDSLNKTVAEDDDNGLGFGSALELTLSPGSYQATVRPFRRKTQTDYLVRICTSKSMSWLEEAVSLRGNEYSVADALRAELVVVERREIVRDAIIRMELHALEERVSGIFGRIEHAESRRAQILGGLTADLGVTPDFIDERSLYRLILWRLARFTDQPWPFFLGKVTELIGAIIVVALVIAFCFMSLRFTGFYLTSSWANSWWSDGLILALISGATCGLILQLDGETLVKSVGLGDAAALVYPLFVIFKTASSVQGKVALQLKSVMSLLLGARREGT